MRCYNATGENRNKQTKRYENKMINEIESGDNYYSVPEYFLSSEADGLLFV